MRVSRIQAAENRQTVINVASRLFRERGFDGIPGAHWRAPPNAGQPRSRRILMIRSAQ